MVLPPIEIKVMLDGNPTESSKWIINEIKASGTVDMNNKEEDQNATNKKVSWSTSDKTVAEVNDDGNVKANKAGTAVVTVTTQDGRHKAKCTVTVKDSPTSPVPT